MALRQQNKRAIRRQRGQERERQRVLAAQRACRSPNRLGLPRLSTGSPATGQITPVLVAPNLVAPATTIIAASLKGQVARAPVHDRVLQVLGERSRPEFALSDRATILVLPPKSIVSGPRPSPRSRFALPLAAAVLFAIVFAGTTNLVEPEIGRIVLASHEPSNPFSLAAAVITPGADMTAHKRANATPPEDFELDWPSSTPITVNPIIRPEGDPIGPLPETDQPATIPPAPIDQMTIPAQPADDLIREPVPLIVARIADVAIESTKHEVTYDAHYRSISYPMGDVPENTGVCSDVVVRSYRAFGIDLQELVHVARLGIGDPSIDHRRVEVLRRYFTQYGEVLPITPFPEDYKPGDIVTYSVPHGHSSKAHIAIVTGVLAPTGRPYIVHNRAWGPKLDDGLFHERISGHFRYDGTRRPILVAGRMQPPSRLGKATRNRRMASSR